MKLVGIDPGSDGALFAMTYDPVTGVRSAGDGLVLPMVDVGTRVREADIAAIADWLAEQKPDLVAVESVGYMPARHRKGGDAGGGSFSGFGEAILTGRFRELVGMLKALKIPYEQPKPQQWQKVLGLKVQAVKGESRDDRQKKVKAAVRAFCQRRYPSAALVPVRCRVPHQGLVDALAMAHWASTLSAPDGANHASPVAISE